MSEPTPGPTPNRAVYGFAWFLFSKTLFVLFIFWALVPDHIQQDFLGLTYLPDKYFAMVIPVLVLTALTFFAFLIYPPMNLAMQDDINDVHTLRDQKTIRRCKFISTDSGMRCEEKVNPIPANEMNHFNIWTFEKFCSKHINGDESQADTERNEIEEQENFCDCLNKANCLLRKKPNHLKILRKRATVPSISDFDVVDVSKQLFLENK